MGSVGFDSGVALSSGALTGSSGNLLGPNDYYKMSTQFLTPGDADLTDLSGVTTLDAAVLEFDFVATDPQVRLAYVFGSEEYNESLEGPNDVFALYVNGTNCATAGTPPGLVRSSTVNLNSNAQLYRNNEDDLIDVELDGLTTVLTCSATVTAGATNHAKLAIADVTHYGWDSDVLIQAGSFRVDPPATVPSAPTIGTATAGNAQATVSWAAPGSNGGAAINGYVVTPYVNGVLAQTATTFGTTATTQTVTGLTNGTAYTFRVAARNAIGTGPQSAASNAVTPASAATVPGAPTIGSAVARDAEVSLSWTAPVSNGGAAINGYVVTPYVNGVAQAARTFGSTATSQVITGLVNGTAYTFRVAARNAVGVGPQSAMSNAATPTGDLGKIVSDGPLTEIATSPDLNCSVHHEGDTHSAWYESGFPTVTRACGTFVAVEGEVYGPADIPAGPTPIPFTPLAQTAVSGTGSEADPLTIVTLGRPGQLRPAGLADQLLRGGTGDVPDRRRGHQRGSGPGGRGGLPGRRLLPRRLRHGARRDGRSQRQLQGAAGFRRSGTDRPVRPHLCRQQAVRGPVLRGLDQGDDGPPLPRHLPMRRSHGTAGPELEPHGRRRSDQGSFAHHRVLTDRDQAARGDEDRGRFHGRYGSRGRLHDHDHQPVHGGCDPDLDHRHPASRIRLHDRFQHRPDHRQPDRERPAAQVVRHVRDPGHRRPRLGHVALLGDRIHDTGHVPQQRLGDGRRGDGGAGRRRRAGHGRRGHGAWCAHDRLGKTAATVR